MIFVRFKIDGLYDWSDQAFFMGLVSEAERDVRTHATGEYQLLNVVLVEAETGGRRNEPDCNNNHCPYYEQGRRNVLGQQKTTNNLSV